MIATAERNPPGVKGHEPTTPTVPNNNERSSFRRLRVPSMKRRRTPSPSMNVAPWGEVQSAPDAFRTAYDAYHGTSFTLAPLYRNDQVNVTSNSMIYATTPLLPASASKDLQVPSSICRLLLDYQDFAPRLTGFDDRGNVKCLDTFPDIVKRANDWLRQNPQFRVRTCETITWSTIRAIEVGDTENVVQVQHGCTSQVANHNDTYCFSGLRLWVIPKEISGTASSTDAIVADGLSGQRLDYKDYKPTKKNSLSQLIDIVNEDLHKNPLLGTITTIETVSLPELLFHDTSCLFWKETSCGQSRKCSIFLRIYYVDEPSTQLQTIGVKNMVPECVNGTYELYQRVLQRAQIWIKNEPYYIRVTNIKTYILPFNRRTLEEDANCCSHASCEVGRLSSSLSSSSPSSSSSQQYFQVLRIFYVQMHRSNPLNTNCIVDVTPICSPEAGCITGLRAASSFTRAKRKPVICAVFSPVQITAGLNIQATFERMKQTMNRVSSWMQEQSDINVHSIETYISPMLSCTKNQCLPEITFWTHPIRNLSTCNERKFLMHIRIYFESSSDQLQTPIIRVPPMPPRSTPVESTPASAQVVRRWQNRKLCLILSCILLFVISIPAGGLFYLNALQSKWGRAH